MPHGVLVRWRQGRTRQRHAPKGSHDPFREQEIPEQRSNEEILAEKLLEQLPGQDIPRNGVCDRSENPIQLP
jgi:hypothetical protein